MWSLLAHFWGKGGKHTSRLRLNHPLKQTPFMWSLQEVGWGHLMPNSVYIETYISEQAVKWNLQGLMYILWQERDETDNAGHKGCLEIS